MRLEPFAMERMQSTYENDVAFNLSESGVHPLTLGELADDDASRAALMAEGLSTRSRTEQHPFGLQSRRSIRAQPWTMSR